MGGDKGMDNISDLILIKGPQRVLLPSAKSWLSKNQEIGLHQIPNLLVLCSWAFQIPEL